MAQIAVNQLLKDKMQEVIDECMGDSPAFCVATCPLHVNVKGYVGKIAEGEYKEALKIIREDLPFPGILGRVCAHPCEEKCRRGDEKQPISVAALKRFAATFDNEAEWDLSIEEEKPQQVAIIGAGPAGAMAAYLLRKKGYKVTIFEALPVVGGMLRVGIPAYRLPRDVIDYEYSILNKLGVEIKLNTSVGKDIEIKELFDKYDAVFLSVGAHKSIIPQLPGSDLKGIVPGVDFLRAVSLNDDVQLGQKVVVIGGGNVAIDVARSAIRKGAEEVTLVCLEKREEMPAHAWEVEEALEEGIKIINSYGMKQFLGSEKVEKIELMECTAVFDENGRFNPQYNEDNINILDTDMVIMAIGQTVENNLIKNHQELLAANGKIKADPTTLQTAYPKVFAGGDAIGRPLIAIEALAHGKKAAISIDRFFQKEDLRVAREKEDTYESKLIRELKEEEKGTVRKIGKRIPIARRVATFEEVELGFSEKEALEEATRCLQCECKHCMKECIMLNDFCEYPKQLMENTLNSACIDPLIPYSCNMCSQCTIKCPQEYKFSEIFGEIRKELVKVGAGPLPGHKPIHMHQYLGFHPIFNIVQSDKKAGFTKRVFMPGCSLPSYNPEAVGKILKHLQAKLPGTGAVLRCCGKPTKAMAMEKEFKERYQLLEDAFEQLGAEEIIVACQSCYATVSQYSPKRKVRSLWELLPEIGIPEEAKGVGKGRKLNVHDSCVTRDVANIHEGIRFILEEMGFEVEELENSRNNTRCCGFGGMVVPVNPDVAQRVMKRRAEEGQAEIMVTYCAACRESMIKGGRKGLHILDLMFNGDYEKTGVPGLQGSLQNWVNRYKAKQQIKHAYK